MKKLLCTVLVLCFALTCTIAIGEEPGLTPYEEPVVIRTGQTVDPTASLPEGQTIEDNYFTRLIKNRLNVVIDTIWYVAEADKDQKINLTIASNDLPDAMVVNAAQFMTMCKSDQLADLTDVYEEYISEAARGIYEKNDGAALKAATYNGKLMAIPSVTTTGDGYHTMWIRKDWLDELGLPVPQTLDEVEATALAFVEAGLGGDNTIGIVGPSSGGNLYATFLNSTNNIYGLDPLFSAMNAFPGYWIKDEDGQVVYGSITGETRAALERIAEMYKSGAIDPEIGVRKESAEAVISGKAGIFFGTWWMSWNPFMDALRMDPTANWQCYAVPLTDEGIWKPHMGSPTNQYLVVRKGYEHPEVAVKLTNLALAGEDGKDMFAELSPSFYPLRIVLSQPDECQFNSRFMRDYLAGKVGLDDFDHVQYAVLLEGLNGVYDTKLEPYDNYDIEYWNLDSDAWGRAYATLVGSLPIVDAEDHTEVVYSLTYSQTETMTKRWTNLKRLEDETFLKIIVGNEPIETFDTFVEEWKAQGGDKITAEVEEIAANQ